MQASHVVSSTSICLSVSCFFCALLGCDQSDSAKPISAEVLAARERFLLSSAPADPILVTDARKLPAQSPMVIVGRLGVAGLPTWEPGKAMFMVSDAHPQVAGHTHAEGERESDCVFCKRSRNERLAMVQFVDAEGNVASWDAQQLLQAKEGDEVTIQGKGEVNSLDVLVVTADGVYLNKDTHK